MVSRRDILRGLLASGLASCTRKSESSIPVVSQAKTPAAPVPQDGLEPYVEEWMVTPRRGGDGVPVAVVRPEESKADAGKRFPVLIALHGRGESLKPPRQGALGWANDYALLRAFRRIQKPPLTDTDFEGFSDPTRLSSMNNALGADPFSGLIVVCPYLPDVDLRKDAPQAEYARFLVEDILPEVFRRTPSLTEGQNVGIDGVSLGGAVAMRAGFMYPDRFGAVGGLQPAIQSIDAEAWGRRARTAQDKNPRMSTRLLTSSKDYFRDGIHGAAREMRRLQVPCELLDVPGPHDYIFNRGPGAYELLFFHHQKLART